MKLQRRHFLQLASLAGTSCLVQPTAFAASPLLNSPRSADPFPFDPTSTYFTQTQREVLTSIGDHALPGAGALGAARFIEQILTAFDFDPPRIFSDGTGFIPLNRFQEKAWRLRLFGSKGGGGGVNDAVLGPVIGLRDEIQNVLDVAGQVLQQAVYPYTDALMISVWTALPTNLQERMVELAVQSTVGDPAYGGNFDKGGWKLIFFEGASLPEGYSRYNATTRTYIERPESPLSGPNPGADPMPVSWITSTLLRFKGFEK